MENLTVRIHSKGELWYVYIYDLATKKIIKKFYKGLNTTDDPEERMVKCYGLRAAIEAELKTGWKPSGKNSLPQAFSSRLTIIEAYHQSIRLLEESDY